MPCNAAASGSECSVPQDHDGETAAPQNVVRGDAHHNQRLACPGSPSPVVRLKVIRTSAAASQRRTILNAMFHHAEEPQKAGPRERQLILSAHRWEIPDFRKRGDLATDFGTPGHSGTRKDDSCGFGFGGKDDCNRKERLHYLIKTMPCDKIGGSGGIRTHGGLPPTLS